MNPSEGVFRRDKQKRRRIIDPTPHLLRHKTLKPELVKQEAFRYNEGWCSKRCCVGGAFSRIGVWGGSSAPRLAFICLVTLLYHTLSEYTSKFYRKKPPIIGAAFAYSIEIQFCSRSAFRARNISR